MYVAARTLELYVVSLPLGLYLAMGVQLAGVNVDVERVGQVGPHCVQWAQHHL